MGKVDQRQINYTAYAPTYDAGRFDGDKNAYLERLRTRAVVRLVGLHDTERRVLDVGCGTGRGLIELGRRGFTRLTGLDYTPAMLDAAHHKLNAALPDQRVQLVRGDAFSLPFGDRAFDLVIALNFLHMFRFQLQRELMSELARVCRPGGLVVAEFENAHKGLFVTRYVEQRRVRDRTKFNSCLEIWKLFDRSGFRRIRVVGTVLPKAYLLFRHAPRLGELVESLTWVPPFSWIAARVVVAGWRR